MAVAISDLAVGRIVGFFGRGIFIELREHAIDTFGIEFGPFLSGVIVQLTKFPEQDVAISGVQTSPRLHGGGSGVVAEAVDGFLPLWTMPDSCLLLMGLMVFMVPSLPPQGGACCLLEVDVLGVTPALDDLWVEL